MRNSLEIDDSPADVPLAQVSPCCEIFSTVLAKCESVLSFLAHLKHFNENKECLSVTFATRNKIFESLIVFFFKEREKTRLIHRLTCARVMLPLVRLRTTP